MAASHMRGDNKFKVDFNAETDKELERQFLEDGGFQFDGKTYVAKKRLGPKIADRR
jgi:hypothetical protein